MLENLNVGSRVQNTMDRPDNESIAFLVDCIVTESNIGNQLSHLEEL